jgi:hypothetical protein
MRRGSPRGFVRPFIASRRSRIARCSIRPGGTGTRCGASLSYIDVSIAKAQVGDRIRGDATSLIRQPVYAPGIIVSYE